MKNKYFITLAFLILTVLLCAYFYPNPPNKTDLNILTESDQITYHVEIADTPYLRSKGLMYRKSMPQNHGMLFIFEKPRIISMWMKNTHIPLDMLFVDKNGIIRHIHENAKPFDETIISSVVPISFVIELNAGQVKEKNIQTLNQVIGL
jgi:uncharacterized membrane protein (UPF0127 family)